MMTASILSEPKIDDESSIAAGLFLSAGLGVGGHLQCNKVLIAFTTASREGNRMFR
jgi:hypothetical protein